MKFLKIYTPHHGGFWPKITILVNFLKMDTPSRGGFGRIWVPGGPKGPKGPKGAQGAPWGPHGAPWGPKGPKGPLGPCWGVPVTAVYIGLQTRGDLNSRKILYGTTPSAE